MSDLDALVIVHITHSSNDREDAHAVFHYYSLLPPLLLNEVLLREINIRFEQQVVLPVFMSGSQSNSWLKVARTLLGTGHILQQDHMRAIHNTDNNSKAHCHLQEKPCFFQQSFAIWLIYHSARLEQLCQELTSLSVALCYWSYQIVCGLVLNRSVFSLTKNMI